MMRLILLPLLFLFIACTDGPRTDIKFVCLDDTDKAVYTNIKRWTDFSDVPSEWKTCVLTKENPK